MKHCAPWFVLLLLLVLAAGCGSAATPATSEAASQQALDALVHDFDAALESFDTPDRVYASSDVSDLLAMGALAHAIHVDLQTIAAHEGQTLPADDANWPEYVHGSAGPLASQVAKVETAADRAHDIATYVVAGGSAGSLDESFSPERDARASIIEVVVRARLMSIAVGAHP